MTKISKALYYALCRFHQVTCSQCDTSLKDKHAISKRMTKRINKKHTKYYCVPCAFKLHILTARDAREHGITIPSEESQ